MTIVVPTGRSLDDIVDYVLQATTRRENPSNTGSVDDWIVAGPPECLGFTPYCGLWFLIEAEPSDHSNKNLLPNIRNNL